MIPRERRYIDTGKRSFFGDMVYERVIPQDHFVIAGLEMGTLQVIDSTHTQSDVNSDKDASERRDATASL